MADSSGQELDYVGLSPYMELNAYKCFVTSL